MLSNFYAKAYSKDHRSCSFLCATALSEGGDESPKCPQTMLITTDHHRPLLLAQRKENNGVRVLKEGVNSVSSKKTKIEKSRKRKLQGAMMKIQQRDEMPNSENQKHRKSKHRHVRSHPDRELVLVETARVSRE